MQHNKVGYMVGLLLWRLVFGFGYWVVIIEDILIGSMI